MIEKKWHSIDEASQQAFDFLKTIDDGDIDIYQSEE